MKRTVLIEQFHLTVRVPVSVPDAEVVVIRQTLAGSGFVT